MTEIKVKKWIGEIRYGRNERGYGLKDYRNEGTKWRGEIKDQRTKRL